VAVGKEKVKGVGKERQKKGEKYQKQVKMP